MTNSSRVYLGVYVLCIGALSALTIGLSYAVFMAGFSAGVESFIIDPSETVKQNPLGILALLGIFVSLFLLFATVVVGGSRYANLDRVNSSESE